MEKYGAVNNVLPQFQLQVLLRPMPMRNDLTHNKILSYHKEISY